VHRPIVGAAGVRQDAIVGHVDLDDGEPFVNSRAAQVDVVWRTAAVVVG
jgi:hypothetical protein